MFPASTTRPIIAAAILCSLTPCAIAQKVQRQVTKSHTSRGEKHSYQREVERLEEQWRQAQVSGDATVMEKLLADDYIGITSLGLVVTKQQQLDRIRNRTTVINKMDMNDVKVKLLGTTAIVTSRVTVEGINDGASVDGMYRYTRVYTRMPGGIWKIVNFESTRIPPPGSFPPRPGRASASSTPPPAP